MIDVLSKYAVVVPIKSKNPADLIAGTMEGLETMRAKPLMMKVVKVVLTSNN
jgi:hypothetical protein